MFGWYNDKWWQISDDRSPFDCTSEQLYEVLDGSFAVQTIPINDNVAVGNWVRYIIGINESRLCTCILITYSLIISFVRHI